MGTAPSEEKDKKKITVRVETRCPGECSFYVAHEGQSRWDRILPTTTNGDQVLEYDPICQWITIEEKGIGETFSSQFYFLGVSQVEVSRTVQSNRRDVCAKMDRATIPWTLTYYRCGDKVKVINMSEHNVTINRVKRIRWSFLLVLP